MDRLRNTPVWMLLFMAVPAAAQSCRDVLDRAQKAFEAQQYSGAETSMGEALNRCPQDRLRIYVSLGQVEYLLGKDTEAEQSLLAALDIDPNHQEALYALGRAYSMRNRFPEAVEKFQAVLRANPANYKAWDNLGVCYDALNQDSDALRSFFKALDLVMTKHPDYDWAHANLAEFFLRRDENEKAFQLAGEAARRNPLSARNCFLTAKALVRLEKHSLSIRWLERAIELEPGYTEALYLLAQTYRKLGRVREAGRMLTRFQEASRNPPPRR